jgi:MFS family permease
LFNIRTFGNGNAVAMLVSLGEFGLLFILPLFLQSVVGYSALETGVILLALALRLVRRQRGRCRTSMAKRLVSRAGGQDSGWPSRLLGVLWLALMLNADRQSGWELVPGLFIYGIGVGFATAQLTGMILAEVPVAESGMASAIQSTSRQVGAAIGTALLGAVLDRWPGQHSPSDLTEPGELNWCKQLWGFRLSAGCPAGVG